MLTGVDGVRRLAFRLSFIPFFVRFGFLRILSTRFRLDKRLFHSLVTGVFPRIPSAFVRLAKRFFHSLVSCRSSPLHSGLSDTQPFIRSFDSTLSVFPGFRFPTPNVFVASACAQRIKANRIPCAQALALRWGAPVIGLAGVSGSDFTLNGCPIDYNTQARQLPLALFLS